MPFVTIDETGQDVFILGLRQFGHVKLAEKEKAKQKESERKTPRK